MIQFTWYTFSELSNIQLYQLLKLRSEVFVVEQQCPYLDIDGDDPTALHLLGEQEGAIVAYLRLFLPTEQEKTLTFGRIVIAQPARTNGYGKQLMQALLSHCQSYYPDIHIKCSRS